MAKSFTIKTDDPGIQLPVAVASYGNRKSQGKWKGYELSVFSTTGGLVNSTYWYAEKDNVVYTDRGLAGMLDYIDKQETIKV